MLSFLFAFGLIIFGKTNPPPKFDYDGYLEFLTQNHHNFIRLWTLELTRFHYPDEGTIYVEHFPWSRSGSEPALDGKPKFDLTQLDQTYFDRLVSRVSAARDRGLYVAIMLFEGHNLYYSLTPWRWDGHPFNIKNNVNGIDGDPDKDGRKTAEDLSIAPAQTRETDASAAASRRRASGANTRSWIRAASKIWAESAFSMAGTSAWPPP
jgi:hypothetical protein